MSARVVLAAAALGAATGIRSTGGLVALSRRVAAGPVRPDAGVLVRTLGRGPVRALVGAAAAGEVLADKIAPLPPRDDFLPLAGRITGGALVGAVAADLVGAPRLVPACMGAAAAAGAAVIATRLRRRASAQGQAGLAAAVGEDTVAAGLGASAARLL